MESALTHSLTTLRRLGKAERKDLKAGLTTDEAKNQFRAHVAVLLSAHDKAMPHDFEDLYIFGVQIADIWPDDELLLDLECMSKAVVAFSVGFAGKGFDAVFADKLHDDMLQQWSHTSENVLAQQPLPNRTVKVRAIGLHKQSAAAA